MAEQLTLAKDLCSPYYRSALISEPVNLAYCLNPPSSSLSACNNIDWGGAVWLLILHPTTLPGECTVPWCRVLGLRLPSRSYTRLGCALGHGCLFTGHLGQLQSVLQRYDHALLGDPR
eukprot:1041936-Rhodomonas_salina.1